VAPVTNTGAAIIAIPGPSPEAAVAPPPPEQFPTHSRQIVWSCQGDVVTKKGPTPKRWPFEIPPLRRLLEVDDDRLGLGVLLDPLLAAFAAQTRLFETTKGGLMAVSGRIVHPDQPIL